MNLRARSTLGLDKILQLLASGIAAMFLLGTAWPQSVSEPPISNFPNTASGPEAQTRSELDCFGRVMEAAHPSEIISAAETFYARFPQSELLVLVQLREMQSEIDAGSFEGALGVGRRLLKTNPDNLQALVLMAQVLSDAPPGNPDERGVLFAEARADLAKARSQLGLFHLPQDTSPQEFLRNKRLIQSSLEESAGALDLAEENYPKAISHFESALALAGAASPALALRLGVCYFRIHDMEKAQTYLQKAAGANYELISQRANELLKEVKNLGAPPR